MNALIALVTKDLILYFSNRRSLLITVAAPIVIAAFFGSLFGGKNTERARIPIAVVDLDGSATSRRVVAAMTADGALAVEPVDATEAADGVRRGKLRAVVTLPPRFGDEAPRALFSRRERPVIDIRYDPSQAIALRVVQGLLAQHVMEAVASSASGGVAGAADITADITADIAAEPRADVLGSPTTRPDARRDLPALFDSVERVRRTSGTPAAVAGGANADAGGPTFRMPYTVKETEARSDAGDAQRSKAEYNGYSHSFAGMGVQFILLMGVDLGIKLLNARRMGLWQRLRAAPLSRGFLLASQIASGAVIATLLFAIIFAAGIAVFGVRIEGSVVGFAALVVAFALMTAAFGLFIAALGRTPEATRGLAVFATLVMVMLGGAWVPAFVFPQWLQTASLAMPTRWAVDGLDAMTWRGLGLEAAWMPVLVLLGFAVAFATIAVARFDWDEK